MMKNWNRQDWLAFVLAICFTSMLYLTWVATAHGGDGWPIPSEFLSAKMPAPAWADQLETLPVAAEKPATPAPSKAIRTPVYVPPLVTGGCVNGQCTPATQGPTLATCPDGSCGQQWINQPDTPKRQESVLRSPSACSKDTGSCGSCSTRKTMRRRGLLWRLFR